MRIREHYTALMADQPLFWRDILMSYLGRREERLGGQNAAIKVSTMNGLLLGRRVKREESEEEEAEFLGVPENKDLGATIVRSRA